MLETLAVVSFLRILIFMEPSDNLSLTGSADLTLPGRFYSSLECSPIDIISSRRNYSSFQKLAYNILPTCLTQTTTEPRYSISTTCIDKLRTDQSRHCPCRPQKFDQNIKGVSKKCCFTVAKDFVEATFWSL